MAPSLVARATCRDEFGNYYYCNSGWYYWGRWVTLGIVVVVAFLFFFAFACFNSRRRRRLGQSPMYGTGWMSKPAYGNGYNNGYNNGYPQAAPPYSPPVENQYTGNTFHPNDGYYGHNTGIELQQPANAYQPQRGGDDVYQPPNGPPPSKR